MPAIGFARMPKARSQGFDSLDFNGPFLGAPLA